MIDGMQVYDGHLHMSTVKPFSPADFLARTAEAQVDGALIISMPPPGLPDSRGVSVPAGKRMEIVRDFCEACGKTYFPCFWIDPLEPDAVSQVKMAKEMGMRALKVICSYHAPSAGLPVYREAVKYDLPILFHSDILWDGLESGKYNRPCEFECMLEAPGVRFALAHVAWPWTDECIALYGKLLHAGRSFGKPVELFIDDCPGTPDIYRKQVFRNFAFLGYDLTDRLIFGSDTGVSDYNIRWMRYMFDFDRNMFAELNEEFKTFNGYLATESFSAPGAERPDLNRIFVNSVSRNLLRFLGEKI